MEGSAAAAHSPVWCRGRGRFHGVHGVHGLGSGLKGGRKQLSLVLVRDSDALAAGTGGKDSRGDAAGEPWEQVLGFRVMGQDTGFREQGLGSGSWVRIQGLGSRVWGQGQGQGRGSSPSPWSRPPLLPVIGGRAGYIGIPGRLRGARC